MKKLIIGFLIMAVFTLGVKAQVITLKSATNYVADTVVNTATKFVSGAVKGGAYVTTIQFQATKISGTGAGTATLLGSLDGTNYRSVSATSYTITDVASQGFIWTLTGNPALYYRVSVTGSGTESLRISAAALTRPAN